VLFMVDARAGITPADKTFADLVRRSGKPIILLANKSESRQGAAGAAESYALGLGDPIGISAEHGEGMGELYSALRALMPDAGPQDEDDETGDFDGVEADAGQLAAGQSARPLRVAIVGRPNAGKSTLINRILGEERLLTSAEAGTTRDAIAVDVTWSGRDYRLFDTAGLRRRSRVDDKLEKLSVADALRAIRFAEVVVVVMDVQKMFEEQDLRIADLVEREGRALVLAVNKWDLAERKPGAIATLRVEADHWLPQVRGVPIIPVSGLTGDGLDQLARAIDGAYAVWNKRVPTSGLNKWFEHMLSANPPPAVSGRSLRLNYITQAKSRPPSFVVFCSRADAVPDSYRRYLVNGLRESFELPGTPIRLNLREKSNPFAHKRRRQ